MKITVQKLMDSFIKNDSVTALNLFEKEEDKNERIGVITRDSKFFQLITKKHGMPDVEDVPIIKDYSGANLVVVRLLNTPDTSLDLKRCELTVKFYPDQFLLDPHKFLYYTILKESISPKKLAPLRRP